MESCISEICAVMPSFETIIIMYNTNNNFHQASGIAYYDLP